MRREEMRCDEAKRNRERRFLDHGIGQLRPGTGRRGIEIDIGSDDETLTMPPPSTSPNDDRRGSSVQAVVGQYHRVERAVSWLIALLVVGVFLAAFAAFSLGSALAVAVILVMATRVPVFRRRGATRLRSEADPETVRREFAGPTPPVLASQWTVADEVTPAADGCGATYEYASPFGLRAVTMELDAAVSEPSGSTDSLSVIELEITANDRPWGAYTVTIRTSDDERDGTVVDVALRPTRRFDLRHLPQALVADRYYADVLAAQGYTVVDREVTTSL